jgi:fermentation-respiration switch protein FrsA (DUF1100 family)
MNPIFVTTLIILFGVYLVASPRFGKAIYRPLLFHPLQMPSTTVAPTINQVTGQEVRFGQERSFELYAWFYRNANTKQVVLVCHGNGGNIGIRPSLIESLLRAGLSVFIYDYCGYGKSVGQPEPTNIIESAVCGYQYLIEHEKFDSRNIFVYGESLGSAPASYLASNFKLAGLIIQSGFSSLHAIAVEKYPFLRIYPDFLFSTSELNTSDYVSRVGIPILIMHGDLDPVVPLHHAESLFGVAHQPKQLVIVNGAHHSDISELHQETFVAAISSFVKSSLGLLQSKH